ncbi:UNVERIFIED_CONTAM: hypothetical protein O8I53_12105 [Campylobacter lari]
MFYGKPFAQIKSDIRVSKTNKNEFDDKNTNFERLKITGYLDDNK